jgi:hypothetical protein
MSPSRAIAVARSRVHVTPYGRGQYAVHAWSPRHDATWVGRMTDWHAASSEAKLARIRSALELAGLEDADERAWMLAQEEGRWDMLVRHELARR